MMSTSRLEENGNIRELGSEPCNLLWRSEMSAQQWNPINANCRFVKHPENYDLWHLTQDNSIEPKDKRAASEFSPKNLSIRSYRF